VNDRPARPLRAMAEVTLGRQRSPEHEHGPFMTRYLRAANVKDGSLDLTDVKEMNFTPQEREVFSLRPGDVLVTEGAGSLAAVGASAVWNGEVHGTVCFQNTLLRLRPRLGTNARFLAWWSRYAYSLGLFASVATGANIFHLSAERVRALSAWLPSPTHQAEIADFLDAETARIDGLIEKKRRMIGLLEERRTAITISNVTNQAWPRVKLTLVAQLGSGHTPSRNRPEWWENPTIPWVTTGDVVQMRGDRIEFIETTKFAISELGLANSAAELHSARTVVLSRTASVGFSAIMAQPMATSQDFVTWTCGPRLSPRFLLLCLRAMRSELLGRLAMGSTHKTIYMPEIEAIRVPLPTVEEQERVVPQVWNRLRPIDAAVAAIERQIVLLREHRQALLTAAVAGELDIAKAAA
jgi:type I restriction enzyme S subunit